MSEPHKRRTCERIGEVGTQHWLLISSCRPCKQPPQSCSSKPEHPGILQGYSQLQLASLQTGQAGMTVSSELSAA